jgi:hypothetical protein
MNSKIVQIGCSDGIGCCCYRFERNYSQFEAGTTAISTWIISNETRLEMNEPRENEQILDQDRIPVNMSKISSENIPPTH